MKKIVRYIHPLLLTVAVGILVWKNFVPGTWLTGWDNLHPEFNFGLNIYRSFYSVWQEYQGLGLLAGMAHASDLPRQLFLLLLSVFLPASSLRYAFHFIMLLAGTLGIYFLMKNIFLTHVNETARKNAAFLSALFYLLNLGTMQYFYVPFEPYSTFWGMFPWEVYIFLRYIEKPDRKNGLLLAFINLMAVPQAYVQTLFVVYLICLGCFALAELWKARSLKPSPVFIKAFLIIICVNAFWLLPNIYFTLHDVKVTQTAVNNVMNTERFFQENKNRGTLLDFALLKEFYYDFVNSGINTKGNFYMMQPWRNHFSQPLIALFGYLFFGLIIAGLFHISAYRKHLLLLFLLSCLAFLSATPVVAEANTLVRIIPLINQIFRNPFTKFIVPAIFVFATLFGYGIIAIARLPALSSQHNLKKIAFATAFALILLIGLPAFNGNLFFSQTRLKIPKDYFELFAYMNSQPNGRIMNMPQDSYWGWGSYRWGSIGSGFLWYGIKQPIMDRAFDVWSKELEQYYWELQYAIKKEDRDLFNRILAKYRISYIIFDEAYTPSDSMPLKLLLRQEEALLKDNPDILLAKQFGVIRVYKTDFPDMNPVLTTSVPSTNSRGLYDYTDTAYQLLNTYTASAEPDYFFPFTALFSGKPQKDSPSVSQTDDSFLIKETIPRGTYTINLPAYLSVEKLVPFRIFAKKNQNNISLLLQMAEPQITIGAKSVPARYPALELTGNANGNVLLSVNNTDYFPITGMTNSYRLIGSSYVKNDGTDMTLKLYSLDRKTTQPLPASNFASAQPCQPGEGDQSVASKIENDTITLSSASKTVCSTYKAAFASLPAEMLYQVDLTYQSQDYEFPKYCFFNSVYNSCLNKDMKKGFSPYQRHISDYFEVGSSLGSSYLSLILETNKNRRNKSGQIAYSDVRLSSYPLVDKMNFQLQTFQQTPDNRESVSSDGTAILQVSIPKLDNSVSYSSLIGGSLYNLSQTESNKLQSGDSVAEDMRISNTGDVIRLYAKNNLINFWINLPEWNSATGAVVGITSKTVSGMPTTLNVSSMTNSYKYLNTYLPKNSSPITDSFVLGPYNEFDTGLQLLFNTNSYNDTPSVLDLKDISLYPFPYTYLSQVYLTNSANIPQEQTQFFTDAQYRISSYGLALPASAKDEMLILPQSYHDGWVLYDIGPSQSHKAGPLQLTFPFLFGKPAGIHVLVDNWANGWKLPNGDRTVAIVFLPQYLEFAGFILLVLTFILLIFFPGFPSKRKKHDSML